MPKLPATYIVTNRPNGTLYVGVTSALVKRVWQHRTSAFEGFAKRHGLTRLVYFQVHATMAEAIQHENRLKKLDRARKIELIQRANPDWRDLWPLIAGSE
jgi:putative endonuclease